MCENTGTKELSTEMQVAGNGMMQAPAREHEVRCCQFSRQIPRFYCLYEFVRSKYIDSTQCEPLLEYLCAQQMIN